MKTGDFVAKVQMKITSFGGIPVHKNNYWQFRNKIRNVNYEQNESQIKSHTADAAEAEALPTDAYHCWAYPEAHSGAGNGAEKGTPH